jgi:glycosyl transferase family 1
MLIDSARLAVRGVRAYQARLPRVRTGPRTGPVTAYFLTPDFDQPAGGVRVFYRHVDALNAAGVDAAVLHSRRGFSCTWFDHETRITDVGSTRLGPDDLLVVPEIYAAMLPTLPRGFRHVIFNQGPHLTFRRDAAKVAHHCATSEDLVAMLTVSSHGEDLLRHAFPHVAVRRIRLGLDPDVLHPPAAPAGRTISYMPRRGGDDATLVMQLLKGRGTLSGWQLSPLDGLSHRETADALRASSIFLHFPYQEGFGLPAVEAMACGSYVVGFHGFGGREFFRPEFSRPVPTGDVLAFATAVEEVLADEARQPGWCRERGLAASRHALSTYSPENEESDVVAFFREALG